MALRPKMTSARKKQLLERVYEWDRLGSGPNANEYHRLLLECLNSIDVYVPPLTALAKKDRQQIERFMRDGKKISAIKLYREKARTGLMDAKELVESEMAKLPRKPHNIGLGISSAGFGGPRPMYGQKVDSVKSNRRGKKKKKVQKPKTVRLRDRPAPKSKGKK